MIATKVLGLTAALSKSNKIKIGILLIEIVLLAYAIHKNSNDKKNEIAMNKIEK